MADIHLCANLIGFRVSWKYIHHKSKQQKKRKTKGNQLLTVYIEYTSLATKTIS